MEELYTTLRLAEEVLAIYESDLTDYEKRQIIRTNYFDSFHLILPAEIKNSPLWQVPFYEWTKGLITRLKSVKGLVDVSTRRWDSALGKYVDR